MSFKRAKKAVNSVTEPKAHETPKVIKIIENEPEKSKFVMPPLEGPIEDYTIWNSDHLKHLQS